MDAVGGPIRHYRRKVSELVDPGVLSRGVGQAQDWPIPTRLDDPLLGLGFGQLTQLFEETGLPKGWCEEFAAEVAEATHAVISRQIGEMSGERTRWAGTTSTLAGVCLAERWDEDADAMLRATPFAELLAVQAQFRADPTVGWSTGPSGLRRLYEYGERGGPLERLEKGHRVSWQLAHERDFEQLDRASAAAVRSQKRRARLPVAACACFAAPRRSIRITDVGETVELPSVWQLVATVLVWGADEARARTLEFLNEEASREVAPRCDRPSGGRVAHSSLGTTSSEAHSWLLRCYEVASAYPTLRDRWAVKARSVSLRELQETVEQWTADRTAVQLLDYRRKRRQLIADVESCRRKDGKLDPTRSLRKLKRLLLFLLLGETSARVGEIARIAPADFLPDYHLDSYVTAAVGITASKSGRRSAAPKQIKAISAETARYLRELLEICRIPLTDTESIWMSHFAYGPEDNGRYELERRLTGPRLRPSSLSGALTPISGGIVVPLLPRPGGKGGFGAHSFRHMGEQLSFEVGSTWLQARKEWQTRVTAQVFCDAQLGHQMAHDKLGYKDLEANRPLWALRTALGEPAASVPGLIDLLAGYAGARRGWNIDAIRGALIRLRIAGQRVAAATQALATLRLERRALRDRPLPEVPAKLDGLTGKQRQELMLTRDVARERRDRDRDAFDDRIEQAHEELTTLQTAHGRIAAELDLIRANGRNHPLPDALPTRAELQAADTPDEDPLDEETWEQAVARADVRLELLALEPDPVSTRIRRKLNLAEFGAVIGMTPSALRKRLRGDHEPWFPLTGPDSPLIVIGDPATSKLRFIDIDKLPNSFLRQLLPEQREMIEQLLAVPMGSTRWGGRRLPETNRHAA
jgi:hypothetical protein